MKEDEGALSPVYCYSKHASLRINELKDVVQNSVDVRKDQCKTMGIDDIAAFWSSDKSLSEVYQMKAKDRAYQRQKTILHIKI
jgi:hypothetical protein